MAWTFVSAAFFGALGTASIVTLIVGLATWKAATSLVVATPAGKGSSSQVVSDSVASRAVGVVAAALGAAVVEVTALEAVDAVSIVAAVVAADDVPAPVAAVAGDDVLAKVVPSNDDEDTATGAWAPPQATSDTSGPSAATRTIRVSTLRREIAVSAEDDDMDAPFRVRERSGLAVL